MPRGIPSTSRTGQALAELVIALLTFVILIIGVTTLTRLSLTQLTLRKTVRLEAGTKALNRSTAGWTDSDHQAEVRPATEHRLNAYTRLERYTPALLSHLPASNYTLSARNFPENELGLRETNLTKIIPLEDAFIQLIYPKSSVRLTETLSFPATDGLWIDANR